MVKVVHCKREPFDFYIGRPSLLGNPYTHIADRKTKAEHRVSTREEAVARWEEYARERMKRDTEFRSALLVCKDKTVGCWCRPQHACHGDTFDRLIALWEEFITTGP